MRHYAFSFLVVTLMGGMAVAEEPPQASGSASSASSDAASATAQGPGDPAPESAPPPSPDPALEEIVVTAQKRAESIQDVPISVGAFSGETLDVRGVTDTMKLPQLTPGLTVTPQASFAIIYLRGIGTDAFLMADPSVALYVDDIYFPFAHGFAQNFGAVERVEVLKGPQGTLFGRNAVGGAINVITKAPGMEPEAAVQLGYGNYDDLQTRGYVSFPIWSEKLAASLAATYNEKDDFREGTVGGRPLPQDVSKAVRFKLRSTPIESIDVTFAALRLEQPSGLGTQLAFNTAPSQLGRTLGIQPQSPYEGSVDEPVHFSLENTVYYGHGTWFTDWFDVRVLGSGQSTGTRSAFDFDGSPEPLVSFDARLIADVKTAEMQILSNESSRLSSWVESVAGFYYFDSRQGEPIDRQRVGGDFSSPLPILPEYQIETTALIDTDSYAFFAQSTLDVTDWLAFTFGGRYQSEKRTIVDASASLVSPDGSRTKYNDYSGQNHTTEGFKPKVALEVRPLEDTLLYFSWQQAVKSGTFNVVVSEPGKTPDFVKAEEMTAYEVGMKSKWLDGLVRLNAAAFQYDVDNPQVQFISLLAGGSVSFENAGSARVRGVDFDTAVQLVPGWVSELELTAGAAFLDPIYTDYTDAFGFDENGQETENNDFSGNQIVRSPKFSGTAGLSKVFASRLGPIEIGGDWYYNDGYFYLAQNTRIDRERKHAVLGLRASYLYEPWNLKGTLFGNNVTDERYNYSRFVTDFGTLDAAAPRATYGFRLNWEF